MSGRRSGRRLVLADASPLIALSIVEGLGWSRALLGEITTTSTVLREIAPGAGRPGEHAILEAVRKRRIRVVEDEPMEPAFEALDAGEATLLRHAVHSHLPCLILIDERAGRRVARELGFAVIGTAGLLIQAKRRGMIAAVRPALERMLANEFRLSADLVRAVLAEAGER